MALIEVKLSETVHREECSSSMKAYQTIKCKFSMQLKFPCEISIVFPPGISIWSPWDSIFSKNLKFFLKSISGMIALKRKLKRIRENKEPLSESL